MSHILPAFLEIKMSFAPGTCFSGFMEVNVMIFNEEELSGHTMR